MIGASIWPRARVGRSSSSAVRPLLPSFAFSGGWMHVPVTIGMVRRLFLHFTRIIPCRWRHVYLFIRIWKDTSPPLSKQFLSMTLL